jgi:riboflavin synthase
LSSLKSGDKVNLELALRASDRLGGHFVLGHVDQAGIILDQRKEDNATRLLISAPEEIREYLTPKGSIAIDGVSLTIGEVHSDCCALPKCATPSMPPMPAHTAEITTLGTKHKGDRLNLEADIIGKYVKNMMGENHGSSSTAALLNKYGYLDKGGA